MTNYKIYKITFCKILVGDTKKKEEILSVELLLLTSEVWLPSLTGLLPEDNIRAQTRIKLEGKAKPNNKNRFFKSRKKN